MSEAKRSSEQPKQRPVGPPSKGDDVRTLVQVALLVLGTGVTILDGWMIGGVAGIVVSVILAVIFLAGYYGIREQGPSNNGRVIGLAVCVGVTLLVFLSVWLSNR